MPRNNLAQLNFGSDNYQGNIRYYNYYTRNNSGYRNTGTHYMNRRDHNNSRHYHDESNDYQCNDSHRRLDNDCMNVKKLDDYNSNHHCTLLHRPLLVL